MIDLTNKRFGRLVVIAREGRWGSQATWRCQCDCGKIHVAVSQTLRIGGTRSCGCLREELRPTLGRTHGLSNTPEHNSWAGMLQRCTNPNLEKFSRYGARGITVCRRWRKFENFIKDMGQRPSPNHSLDRKNNNRGYFPANCRWATPKQQARNSAKNRILENRGERRCLAEWAELSGVDESVIRGRIDDGWSVSDAIETPVRPCRRRAA